MSTVWSNEWEGPANGTVATAGTAGNIATTTGNPAGNTSYCDFVTGTAGGTAKFVTTNPDNGANVIEIVNVTSGNWFVGIPVNATVGGVVTGDLGVALATDIYLQDIPTDVIQPLVQIRTAANYAATVNVLTTGKLMLASAGGTIVFVASTALTGLPKWIHIEAEILSDAAAGTLNMRAYDMTGSAGSLAVGSAIVGSSSGTLTAQNTRGGALVDVRLGKNAATTWVTPIRIGSTKIVSGSTVPANPGAGPYVATGTGPVVTPGAAMDVTAGGVASFTSTATDSVNITTGTGAFTTLPPGASTPTLTGTATGLGTTAAALNQTATLVTPGLYVWTPTFGDGTFTGQATQSAYVSAAAGTYADPQAVVLGANTNVGGAATPLAAISDTNPATYLEGPPGSPLRVTLPPLPLGPITIEDSAYWATGAVTRTLTLFMADGTTQVDTTSYALTNAEVATAWISADAGNHITTVPLRRALIFQSQDA